MKKIFRKTIISKKVLLIVNLSCWILTVTAHRDNTLFLSYCNYGDFPQQYTVTVDEVCLTSQTHVKHLNGVLNLTSSHSVFK